MTDMTDDKVKALLDGATPGRRVQFHGSYCPEAVGTPFTDWDTSHDMSVIRPDGSRYRLAHYKHASDAYLSQMAPDLARALLDARADAQAAVAGVVERCAGSVKAHSETARKKLRETYDVGDADGNALWNCIVTHLDIAEEAIRSIADPTGVKLLAELRARAEGAEAELQRFHEERAYVIGANDGWDAAIEQGEASPAVSKAMVRFWKKLAETHNSRAERAEAERDTLRAQLAEAQKREAGTDEATAFDRADWFWRTMDPDDCGDSPEEAINRAMVGRFCVCEIASSYSGPTRYGFIAPVLDPERDDEEFVHFATQQEAIDAAKARAALSAAPTGEESNG